MFNKNYLFNLRKILNTNNNNTKIIFYGDTITKSKPKLNLETIIGPTGPSGDRFSTKTQNALCLNPGKNITLFFKVEPGLAYITGNSVIVSEVGDNINSEFNTFEGTIQFYSFKSGEIAIKEITNIKGEFGENPHYYFVNLDGVDGAQGPIGPTGPSCISEDCNQLQLINNELTIPIQENPISYYVLNLKNNDEISKLNCYLKNNQQSTILIKLNYELQDTDSASIHPIFGINNNFINIIYLNYDIPYAIMVIHKIEKEIFCQCNPYYKNTFNIKI